MKDKELKIRVDGKELAHWKKVQKKSDRDNFSDFIRFLIREGLSKLGWQSEKN